MKLSILYIFYNIKYERYNACHVDIVLMSFKWTRSINFLSKKARNMVEELPKVPKALHSVIKKSDNAYDKCVKECNKENVFQVRNSKSP